MGGDLAATMIVKSIEVKKTVFCDYHAPIEIRLEVIVGSYNSSDEASTHLTRPVARHVVTIPLTGEEIFDAGCLDNILEVMLTKARYLGGTKA